MEGPILCIRILCICILCIRILCIRILCICILCHRKLCSAGFLEARILHRLVDVSYVAILSVFRLSPFLFYLMFDEVEPGSCHGSGG
jgi:hypothetical protein